MLECHLPVCSVARAFCEGVGVHLVLHTHELYSLAWEGDLKSKQVDCVALPGS